MAGLQPPHHVRTALFSWTVPLRSVWLRVSLKFSPYKRILMPSEHRSRVQGGTAVSVTLVCVWVGMKREHVVAIVIRALCTWLDCQDCSKQKDERGGYPYKNAKFVADMWKWLKNVYAASGLRFKVWIFTVCGWRRENAHLPVTSVSVLKQQSCSQRMTFLSVGARSF